jgi:hypothetical protein
MLLVKEYQKECASKLRCIFKNSDVDVEWNSETSERHLYCPKPDIAIGPFATGDKSYIHEYDEIQNSNSEFLEKLISIHNDNMSDSNFYYEPRHYNTSSSRNNNARCFLAIEIENKVSRKHLLGGAFNASALGRYGILVAYNPPIFRAMKRLDGYFKYLYDVKRNSFPLDNLFILDKSQFSEILENFLPEPSYLE